MAFGIISFKEENGLSPISPQLYSLRLRNEQLPGIVDLSSCRLLHPDTHCDTRKVLDASMLHDNPAHRLPAFVDSLGLLCDWLPAEGIRSIIDNPFPFPATTMGERPESRTVWRSILRKREVTLSETCKMVLEFYDAWEGKKPDGFGRYQKYLKGDMVAFFHQAFDATTLYLRRTEPEQSIMALVNHLITAHILINATSLQQAEENIKNGHNKKRDNDSLPENRDPIFTERAYIYADNVPQFVKEMQRVRPHANYSYEDTWWMMMMRLHAWTMCVEWVDRGGVKIPSAYYDNPTRVYIL